MTRRAGDSEVFGDERVARLRADLDAAVRRKSTQETRLGGAVRVLAPYSPGLCTGLLTVLETLVRRGSYQRPLYAGVVRALAASNDARAEAPLSRALASDECGGLATLSAATLSPELALEDALARVAMSRHPHLAFAAELARVIRGTADGRHVESLAPMIKESHRIALCLEVMVPLLWQAPLPEAAHRALGVLRGQERHLGRWLVLGELGALAGDPAPLDEARQRASEGPQSARAAWSLVAWALCPDEPPLVRPTVELISRLSDRPSAERDTTFLYRLATARIGSTRAMLENLVKGKSLGTASAIRAALFLARDYGRGDLQRQLAEVVASRRRAPLRGLAAAALLDCGEELPVQSVDDLALSKDLPTVAWALLIKAHQAGSHSGPIVSEPAYRRVQLGWIE